MQREFISTLNWVKDALYGKDKVNNWERWKKEIAVSSTISGASFLPRLPVVTHLPYLSFTLHIPFQLYKPYHSKDDCDFHLLDNPLRKDKVFQLPMVASTGWKGALRAAMVQELVAWWRGVDENGRDAKAFAQRRFQLARLFGDEKGEEPDSSRGLARYLDEIGGNDAAEKFRQEVRNHFSLEADDPMPHFQGSLYFFPTFFDNIGLEVINPHDRRTGVGSRGPILMECVPPGSKGEFTLLYVPFSPTKQSEEERRHQVAEDLKAVAQGIRSMLTVYGFGAKTSSGFGTVEERLTGEGQLVIRAKLAGGAISGVTQLESLQPDTKPVWRETTPVSKFPFCTLSKLYEVTERLAAHLQRGGEA